MQPKSPQPPFNLKKFIPALILLVLIIVAGALGVSGINASRERAAREQTAREQAAVQQQQADAIRQKVESYRDRFCPGVYVNGIDLGGKTYEEAKTAVEAGIQAQHADWKVTLTYGENHADITAADLNFTVDVTGVLNEAMQQGHTGSDEQRYADMLQLEQTPYRVSTARPTGSTQKIDDLLAAIKNSIDRPAQDAYYTLDPENINAPFQFFDEVYGLTLDTEPIRKWMYAMIIAGVIIILIYAIWLIREIRSSIAEAEMKANTDVLTGLQNRNRYEAYLKKLEGTKEKLVCLFVDANGLHELNNSKGHTAGDQMLRFIADTRKVQFGGEHIYRIGGDEFVVFQSEKSQSEIDDSLAVFNDAMQRNDYHAAVGSCTYDAGMSINQLVGNAEKAMYEAKNAYYQQLGKAMRA